MHQLGVAAQQFVVRVVDRLGQLRRVLLLVERERDHELALPGRHGHLPDGVELVLTGRGALPEVIEKADLVTEMREIKHYYQAGVRARKGIES